MGNRKKKREIDKKKWSKLVALVTILLVAALTVYSFRDLIFCSYPDIVMQYKARYNQMASSEYLKQLRAYARDTLKDSLEGLNWTQLLAWEHEHLSYWSGDLEVRPEMPIKILSTNLFGEILMKDLTARYAIYCTETNNLMVYLYEGETTDDILSSWRWLNYSVGRCGEFALLYNGLLLANGYRSRIVVDCSIKTDTREADDHVWNEIFLNETWIHIDTTEACEKYPNIEPYFNHPEMYASPDRWDKNVNCVFAIEGNTIEDVTAKYAGD